MLQKLFFLLLFCVSLYSRSFYEIKNSKILKIAMRQNAMTYYLEQDKIISGFNYALAIEFSKFLGVKLELVHVNMFKDYWLKDNEFIFNMEPPVTPDIFKQADMVLDITSVNEKRKKYINMVPYIENKTIIFSNKNLNIKNVKDLVGKKVFLFEGMQSEYLLKNILKNKNIKHKILKSTYDVKNKEIVYYENFDFKEDAVNLVVMDIKAKMPFLYIYLAVYEKDVDATSTDAFSLFQKLHMYEYLKEDLTPSFTLEKEMGYLSATMPKHSDKLKEQFSKFIDKSKKDGLLNSLMLKYLNVDLDTYIKILEYHEN